MKPVNSEFLTIIKILLNPIQVFGKLLCSSIKIKFLLVSLFFTLNVNSYSDVGINFSVVMQPTYVNENFSLITGGRFGFNLSPELYIGISAYGTTLFKSDIGATDPLIDVNPIFEMYYYGIEPEYYFNPKDFVGVSVSLFAGKTDILFNIPTHRNEDGTRYYPKYSDGSNTFILKPAVNINLNLKDFYRIAIGLSYRFLPSFNYVVSELVDSKSNNTLILKPENLNGLALNFMVRFGSF